MGGKPLHQKHNFKDPFTAGQMVGMLIVLTFIEKEGGIPEDVLDRLKQTAAENAQEYFDKPTEDIFLMIDNILKEKEIL